MPCSKLPCRRHARGLTVPPSRGLLLLLLLLLLLRPRPAAKEERAVGLEGADVAERAGLRRAGALGGRVGRDDALAARALPSTQHSTASCRARAGRLGKLKQRRVVLVLEAHALVPAGSGRGGTARSACAGGADGSRRAGEARRVAIALTVEGGATHASYSAMEKPD